MAFEWLLYPALGVIAGVLAGLLGVGGGLVLVAALVIILPLRGVPADLAMHAALATSLTAIIVTAAASARAHHRRGSVLWPTVRWLVPGLLLGAWAGSALAVRMHGSTLRVLVIAYCALAGVQLAVDWPRPKPLPAAEPKGLVLTMAGTAIGLLSALVGIGGGSMTVPLLVWRGVAPVRAVGTSSACGIAIGLAAAFGYATQAAPHGMPYGSVGYVFLPAAIGIAVTSVLAAPWGARLAHWLSPIALKRLFAVFLLVVAASLATGAGR